MSFAHPAIAAFALVLAAGLGILVLRFARRKADLDRAYSDIAFFERAIGRRRWIAPALNAMWLLALASMAVAAGGPRVRLPSVVRSGAVFVCIDTSGSMASTDVAPTRAQAAAAAARAFIAESPPGIAVGIIGFSSTAEIVQPLTRNRRRAEAAVDRLPLPNGATAIGDALQLAGSALPKIGHRAIVLVTDGVDNAGVDPLAVARWLGAHHVPIYTIGIGTTTGGLIPGTLQEATIDSAALRAYARLSGGAYARVADASQLRAALGRLGRVTALRFKKTDAAAAFALFGGAVAVAAFLLGLGVGKYP